MRLRQSYEVNTKLIKFFLGRDLPFIHHQSYIQGNNMESGHKTAMLELSDYLKSDKGFFVSPDLMLKEFVNRFISKYGQSYITEKWLVQTTAKKIIKGLNAEIKAFGSLSNERVLEIVNSIKDESNRQRKRNKKSYTKTKTIDRKWREVRYKVLKRDGARCACCGMTAKDGVKIHVDHTKPVSIFPLLRYDMDNLQVLCEMCNIGKSNKDDTDWR